LKEDTKGPASPSSSASTTLALPALDWDGRDLAPPVSLSEKLAENFKASMGIAAACCDADIFLHTVQHRHGDL
jgi:hypothetical protein